jgi:hypothetical protein
MSLSPTADGVLVLDNFSSACRSLRVALWRRWWSSTDGVSSFRAGYSTDYCWRLFWAWGISEQSIIIVLVVTSVCTVY